MVDKFSDSDNTKSIELLGRSNTGRQYVSGVASTPVPINVKMQNGGRYTMLTPNEEKDTTRQKTRKSDCVGIVYPVTWIKSVGEKQKRRRRLRHQLINPIP